VVPTIAYPQFLRLLTWAEDRGILLVNHLKDFRRLYHSDRSDLIWLPEHVDAFMKVAPIELTGLILALHTGQRQGDLLRLTWSAYDGTAITLRQSKSRKHGKQGRLVVVPCTKALRRMLDKLTNIHADFDYSRRSTVARLFIPTFVEGRGRCRRHRWASLP